MRAQLLLLAVVVAALAGCAQPAVEAGPDPAASPDGSTGPAAQTGVPAQEPSPTSAPADLDTSSDRLHWSGVVDVTQSMLFLPWETLTIAPGTTVRFHQLPDGDLRATPWVPQADAYIKDHDDPTGHEGYKQSHVSLIGRIEAVGTADQPILFTSAADEPGYADWNQLTLLSGSRLENVTTEYTHNGINVQGNDVTLANVVARESLWSCIDVYGTRITLRDIEAYHCWHSAIGFKGTGSNTLTGAFAHDAIMGVNCENGAQPVMQDVRIERAHLPPMCPTSGVTVTPGTPDVAGGTYKGELVYPSTLP